MKLIAWLLCLTFTMNVFASSGLNEVVDDYNYTMTVEWDQVDQDFYNTQTEIFVNKIQGLIANGLTQKEVENFVAARISDKASLEKLALVSKNAKTTQDVVALLKDHSLNLYQRGANWNGEVVLTIATSTIAAVYVIWVTYSLIKLDPEAE